MMLHPATAHFAIVLPVVASVFGLIYLATRSESMSKISSRATLLAALAMIGVWYTGNDAGPLIYDYLSAHGKEELLEHKELGLYLAIAMGIIALLKIIGCKTKKFAIEALAIVLLLATTATTFLQGKHGGELVYNYGMPFKAYKIQDILSKTQASAEDMEEDEEKVEAYEDAMDEINTISAKVDKVYGNAPKEEAIDDEE
ncbi:MAG: hypothetical protein QM497_09890 [Sulfurimonas sp.]